MLAIQKNEVKELKCIFLGMVLSTVGASLLVNILTGTIKAGQDF